MFKDKTVLITGGTGSFGNVVIKRFLDTGVNEIRIFSRDEKKQDDMRNAYRNDKLKFYIGDVRDYESIHSAMHGVDYVFHAAACNSVTVANGVKSFLLTNRLILPLLYMDRALRIQYHERITTSLAGEMSERKYS